MSKQRRVSPSDLQAYLLEVRQWMRAWMIDLAGVESKEMGITTWAVSNLMGIAFDVAVSYREEQPIGVVVTATVGRCPSEIEKEVLRWMGRRNLELESPGRLGVTGNGIVKAMFFTDSTLCTPEQVGAFLDRFLLETRAISQMLKYDYDAASLN